MPNVPHRIASKLTVKSRAAAASSQLPSVGQQARPRSLHGEGAAGQDDPSGASRPSGVFDDSPIIDLDADDELEEQCRINAGDSDTMKRAGNYWIYINILGL